MNEVSPLPLSNAGSEDQLDRALEDSMAASDPPATTQPDVRVRDNHRK